VAETVTGTARRPAHGPVGRVAGLISAASRTRRRGYQQQTEKHEEADHGVHEEVRLAPSNLHAVNDKSNFT
jgi:hypothetical protein